jgi:2-haloacid dehalogenase
LNGYHLLKLLTGRDNCVKFSYYPDLDSQPLRLAMPISRRGFLSVATIGAAMSVLAPGRVSSTAAVPRIKALAFDAFAILDPRPIFERAERLFPGKGVELSNTWRIRQFEYQWLRALSGHYADFWRTTEDALVFSANTLKLELPLEKRDQLMAEYLKLKVWPDVPSTLRWLSAAGIRLALLSNATSTILNAGIRNSELDGAFEHVLSTDSLGVYKPDPRAYQMAVDAFGLGREDIGFVAFAGWDVAGAKWFGYPTFWANRLNVPLEALGVVPDATGGTLAELVAFLNRSPRPASRTDGVSLPDGWNHRITSSALRRNDSGIGISCALADFRFTTK